MVVSEHLENQVAQHDHILSVVTLQGRVSQSQHLHLAMRSVCPILLHLQSKIWQECDRFHQLHKSGSALRMLHVTLHRRDEEGNIMLH